MQNRCYFTGNKKVYKIGKHHVLPDGYISVDKENKVIYNLKEVPKTFWEKFQFWKKPNYKKYINEEILNVYPILKEIFNTNLFFTGVLSEEGVFNVYYVEIMVNGTWEVVQDDKIAKRIVEEDYPFKYIGNHYVLDSPLHSSQILKREFP